MHHSNSPLDPPLNAPRQTWKFSFRDTDAGLNLPRIRRFICRYETRDTGGCSLSIMVYVQSAAAETITVNQPMTGASAGKSFDVCCSSSAIVGRTLITVDQLKMRRKRTRCRPAPRGTISVHRNVPVLVYVVSYLPRAAMSIQYYYTITRFCRRTCH